MIVPQANQAPPAKLAYEAPKLGATAAKELKRIEKAYGAAEAKLEGINELTDKAFYRSQLNKWAEGHAADDLALQNSLLLAGSRDNIRSDLRQAVKNVMRSLREAAGPLLVPALDDRIEQLKEAALNLEETERAAADAADVVFRPSSTALSYARTIGVVESERDGLAKGRAVSVSLLREVAASL